jgi:hypothetical protein
VRSASARCCVGCSVAGCHNDVELEATGAQIVYACVSCQRVCSVRRGKSRLTLDCPRCQSALIIAGTGYIDRDGYDMRFMCMACRLTVRHVLSRGAASTVRGDRQHNAIE